MLVKFSRPTFLWLTLLVCLASFDGAAAGQAKQRNSSALPRVGTIKDYPATGLMTGCGNLYFYPASQATPANAAAYVFIAHGDGSNAWMNLGGRDVRLRQIRSHTQGQGRPRGYRYRFGTLRIDVVIEPFKPESATVEEGDSMFKMNITLRQGSLVRIVKAVGDSDC